MNKEYNNKENFNNFATDEKGRIILNYKSILEEIIQIIMILLSFIILVSLAYSIEESDPKSKLLLIISLTTISLLYFIKKKISYYWLIDSSQNKIFSFRKFFNKTSKIGYINYNEVIEFGVNCKYFSSKTEPYYIYWTTMLLNSGKMVRVSNEVSALKNGLKISDELSQNLSLYFKVNYLPIKKGKTIFSKLDIKSNKYKIVFNNSFINIVVLNKNFVIVVSIIVLYYLIKQFL
jgi:hypothetical protein